MARNNKNRKRSGKSSKKVLRNRRMARRTPRTSRSTPIDYIVKGARTLIGLLPGQQILKPIADFIFGETKVSSSLHHDLVHWNGPTPVPTSVMGLQVSMDISPTAAIVDSPSIVTAKGGSEWYSNYTHCCLKSLSVTVISTCPTAKKSGMWGVSLQPFSLTADKILTYRQITEAPMSKFGPVTRPLTMNFIPTPRYPGCYGMIPINNKCLRIFVAFEDPQDGSSYTSEDFGCNIQISGSVSLCCRSDGLRTYQRDVSSHSENLIYTSDKMLIHESDVGSGRADLEHYAMD